MSERVKELIEELKNFRTRARAKRELIGMGDEAVDDLIALLKKRSPNTTWVAIKILEQIGSPKAVEPLVELLSDNVEKTASIDALRRITGENFGGSPDLWLEWLKSGKKEGKETAPAFKEEEFLSDDDVIDKAIEGTKISKYFTEDTYTLEVPLKGNRTQKVKVLFGAKDFEAEDVVTVYTECGPSNARVMQWALNKNLTLRYGAFALRKVRNESILVMVNTLLRHPVNIAELKKTILTLAEKADAVENYLTGADVR
jgi:hypothetical protein